LIFKRNNMSLIGPHHRTASGRFKTFLDTSNLSKERPNKKLVSVLRKNGGRNFSGKVTTRHQGGRHKRLLREIDWKRMKRGILAKVVSLEYDPNRSAHIALICYPDGVRTYILAPDGLSAGDNVESGKAAEIKPGNSLPLSQIPIGTPIHNIELTPGKGAQIVRSAGSAATIQSKGNEFANILLPSREVRLVNINSYATIGQVSNSDWKNLVIGKAGRKRHMGVRPTVRGTAQHPDSHPHGGGEARSGEGMPPKTPWGKPARGKKTRKRNKYSNSLIVKRRK
jgi:large subunit ribosomal protein L2